MALGKLYVCVAEPALFEADRAKPTDAEAARDRLGVEIGAVLSAAEMGAFAGTAKVTATFGTEDGRAEAFTLISDNPIAEEMVRGALAAAADDALGRYAVAAVFDVSDTMVAESLTWDIVWKAGLQDRVALHFADDENAIPANDAYKSLEVYYDIAKIPEGFGDPLAFRNAAMEHIEGALTAAGAGEWVGAESGMGEVNFGFEVEDFDRAEKIIRASVQGTAFEGIREIARFSYPDDSCAA